MSSRDRRYSVVKLFYDQGKIQTFKDIFEFIPKSVVAKDLGKKVDRFTVLINKVEKFKVEELFRIGRFCSLDEDAIMNLVLKEHQIQKPRRML